MSRKLLPLLLCACFVTLAGAADGPASAEILRDIEFAKPNGHALKLDLYLPHDRSVPVPVVVFVHGGGWKNGSRKSGEKTAAWLTDHGIAVASIDYRLTDVAQWPAQIDDCYAAVRWVRDHADKYSLDGDHIGAWGTSAGGHLVALMGTREFFGQETTSSRVQAVCDWFGPSELLVNGFHRGEEKPTVIDHDRALPGFWKCLLPENAFVAGNAPGGRRANRRIQPELERGIRTAALRPLGLQCSFEKVRDDGV